MKKVLFLVNHDIVIYNFRKELVEKLLLENYKVIISSPYGERIDKLISMGCDYIAVDIERHGKNPINEIRLFKYYKKIIRNTNPDFVLTFTIKPNIFGGLAAKKYKIPYIANITGLGTAIEKKSILQKLLITFYKHAFSDIQRVFFQNKENMKFFSYNNIVVNKHKLIPGSGVNLNHFSVLKYPESEKIEFVFISRIMKQKGIDQYIEAAKYISNKYKNIRFHVCGFCEEKKYEDVLKDLQRNGILDYHGMVEDIRTVLSNTHCTIHPSYYPEGISNVLLESAASGRPVIATNRSGCKEVIDEGINGFLIEEKNSQDLISKIEVFISLSFKERKKMGLEGRAKVVKEFDRNLVVNAYIEELDLIQ